ncbi:MAG: DUF4037 domain-containing protein [Lachnospiraceae bacterium]|nr:DUF4037 domain-containing protein [Lachnospiraceae bacterium]
MNGLELSERFFEEYGREMLKEQFAGYESVIAAGVAGEGSDCFGYDDEVSRDHDFEAGFCLWIPDVLERELEFKLSCAYGKLPGEYLGVKRKAQSFGGGTRRGVMLTGDFYQRFTGRPGVPESLEEWLELPEYSLACAVNGKIFRDTLGEFSAVRESLKKGYPEDVRKKKIAARAVLMAQAGQYNFMRCIRHGEPGAAVFALNEFVKNGLSMLFLLSNRYMPYYKWAFRAAGELPRLSETAARLEGLLTAYGPGGEKFAEETIESVCASVLGELRRQHLTDGPWEYLEPHAFKIQEQIQDGKLRNLHVMIG